MKELHQKIGARVYLINQKKINISREYEAAKKRLTSTTGLSLTTLGGLVIGFLLLPKKMRIIRSALRVYTMAATVKGIYGALTQDTRNNPKNKN